jgi:hypothetical protein
MVKTYKLLARMLRPYVVKNRAFRLILDFGKDVGKKPGFWGGFWVN